MVNVVSIFTRIFETQLCASEVVARNSRVIFDRGIFDKRIAVAEHHNWPDLEPSQQDSTPIGDGVWGEVSFISMNLVT